MINLYVQIEITNRCNLRCKHCYIENYIKDLSLKEFIFYFNKIENYIKDKKGIINVAITGGEPLVNLEWMDIIQYLRNRDIVGEIVLFTNGTLNDQKSIDFINKIGITSVQVSLDGIPEIHDQIRGKGNFERAINGIQKIKIPVTTHITINKLNIKNFREFVKCCSEVNISYILVSKFIIMGQGNNIKNLSITPDEWFDFYESNISINEEYKGKIFVDFDRIYNCLMKYKVMSRGCGIGEHNFTMLQNGDIMLCRRLPYIVGNLNQLNFQEIWENNELIKNIRSRIYLKGKCGECTYKEYCGGCRATAYSISGDIYGSDEYCLVYKKKENKN